MKKIIITMLLILGFGIGANAQNNEISATADKHALNLTKAVHELLGSSVTVDEYTDKCSKIGLEMGLYMANLSEEETEYFLDQFRNSIYYNCAQYGIDKTLVSHYWRYVVIEAPCYYISYAMSALPCIELLAIAETEGFEVAQSKYLKFFTLS